MADIPARLKLRTGTSAAWTSANPVLAAGEPGFESDRMVLRIGDGSTAFLSLPQIKTTDDFEAAFQPRNDNLQSIAALTLGADRLIYGTGIGAVALAALTARARAFLAAATREQQQFALEMIEPNDNANLSLAQDEVPTRGAVKAFVDALAAGAVGAARIHGDAIQRLADMPVLDVVASAEYEFNVGLSVASGTLENTDRINFVTAWTITVNKYQGSIRFSATVRRVNGTDCDTRVFKNGVQVASWRTSSSPTVRSVDISVIPGDVIVWDHKPNNTGGTSILGEFKQSASDGYVTRTPIGRASA